MRLFLFIKRTAFVIAADSHVIKLAVKKHFGDTDDATLITSYFDKLIQIPIQVPSLGTQEVRAYLALLTVQASGVDDVKRQEFRGAIRERLARSWEGKRVDDADFLTEWAKPEKLGPGVVEDIRTNMRLGHMLTGAKAIAGNPRLIKRFLNVLELRRSLARSQSISVDDKVLTKLLLLERCGTPSAYQALLASVNADRDGKPKCLDTPEKLIKEGAKDKELTEPWGDSFLREWLAMEPALAAIDIRKELYVGRESAVLASPDERLSSEGVQLLRLLLEQGDQASSMKEDLKKLPKGELEIVYSRLVEGAERATSWAGSTPEFLSLLTCVEILPELGSRFAEFLKRRSGKSIEPSLVPKLRGLAQAPWADDVLNHWSESQDVLGPVKKAIGANQAVTVAKPKMTRPEGL